MIPPLVSIICLCYNHERYLREALDSVLAQTYSNLEIIIADDASTDNSVAIIQEYCKMHAQWQFIKNERNRGSCATFNRAFCRSSGAYIIDFATDDVLLPHRVAEQVNQFLQLDASFGVIYGDAELIDENSKPMGRFYRLLPNGKRTPPPATGYIYEQLLKRFFISAPTMMMKRVVLEKLQGYDESLAYEDFDFWVRSAKEYQYFFQNQVLTKRRLHPHQLSRQIYVPRNQHLISTVKVCYKAYDLNASPAENQALAIRVKYELKHAYLTRHFKEARLLVDLLEKIQGGRVYSKLITCLIYLRVSIPRSVYHLLVSLNRK